MVDFIPEESRWKVDTIHGRMTILAYETNPGNSVVRMQTIVLRFACAMWVWVWVVVTVLVRTSR